jgi:hypothetical protein
MGSKVEDGAPWHPATPMEVADDHLLGRIIDLMDADPEAAHQAMLQWVSPETRAWAMEGLACADEEP